MVDLLLTVTEDATQVTFGIPKTLTLSTNFPSTIFYTIDDSEPSFDSDVYLGPIRLPTNQNTVIFKAFASDGTLVSTTTTKTYKPDVSVIHKPMDTVLNANTDKGAITRASLGASSVSLPVEYGEVGLRVTNAPDIEDEAFAYDGQGNRVGIADDELTTYSLIVNDRDTHGNYINKIGTISPKPTVIDPPDPNTPVISSKTSSRFFNPKALIIYSDSSDPNPNNIVETNSQFFSFMDLKKNPGELYNTAFESGPPTGGFVRWDYNPRDGTITYAYRDSNTNRWIFSKEKYQPNDKVYNYSGMVFPSSPKDTGASRFVYRWPAFSSRKLG